MSVSAQQRFTRKRRCPVCGGGGDLARGQGNRCSGYLRSDGNAAFCTREEHAGQLEPQGTEPASFLHLLEGDCGCGTQHAPAPSKPVIVKEYDYTDAAGGLLFQVVRSEPKKFLQRRPDGAEWIWNLEGVERVLFRLPRVLDAVASGSPVYVAEGEKDVLAIEQAGAAATCNSGGAGKWRPEHTEALRGADVVVVADRDESGRKHADTVARSLAGVANSIRLVEPLEGKDAHDHLAAGHSLEELVASGNGSAALTELERRKKEFTLPFAPLGVALADVSESPDWIWHGYLARGAKTILAARPKLGKSTLLFGLLGVLASGSQFLGQETDACGVLLLSEEPAEALRQKAVRFGLDVSAAPLTPKEAETNNAAVVHLLRRGQALGEAWEKIVEEATSYALEHDLAVIVVDTLDSWAGLRGDDENKTGALLGVLEPLEKAVAAGLAVLVITHHRKSGGEFGEGVRGGNALVGAVDLVIEMDRLPGNATDDNRGHRIVRGLGRFADDTPDELVVNLREHGYELIGSLDEHKKQHALTETIATVRALDGSATIEAFRDEAGIAKTAASDRLLKAHKAGHLGRSGTGKKGDPYTYHLDGSAG